MNTDADLEANDVDVGTVMLQDAVDKTLQLILYNAYSGGATPSPPIELDGDVNAIIGSMVLEAFSGRAAAKNQSVRHAEHSDGGGAEGSRDDEIKTEAKKYDYEKWSAELQADFEEVSYRATPDRANILQALSTADLYRISLTHLRPSLAIWYVENDDQICCRLVRDAHAASSPYSINAPVIFWNTVNAQH